MNWSKSTLNLLFQFLLFDLLIFPVNSNISCSSNKCDLRALFNIIINVQDPDDGLCEHAQPKIFATYNKSPSKSVQFLESKEEVVEVKHDQSQNPIIGSKRVHLQNDQSSVFEQFSPTLKLNSDHISTHQKVQEQVPSSVVETSVLSNSNPQSRVESSVLLSDGQKYDHRTEQIHRKLAKIKHIRKQSGYTNRNNYDNENLVNSNQRKQNLRNMQSGKEELNQMESDQDSSKTNNNANSVQSSVANQINMMNRQSSHVDQQNIATMGDSSRGLVHQGGAHQMNTVTSQLIENGQEKAAAMGDPNQALTQQRGDQLMNRENSQFGQQNAAAIGISDRDSVQYNNNKQGAAQQINGVSTQFGQQNAADLSDSNRASVQQEGAQVNMLNNRDNAQFGQSQNAAAMGDDSVNIGPPPGPANIPVHKHVADRCGDGWHLHKHSCFRAFLDYQIDWLPAQKKCELLGANLASIHNDAENEFTIQLMETVPEPEEGSLVTTWDGVRGKYYRLYFWLGMIREPILGQQAFQCSWIDRTPMDFGIAPNFPMHMLPDEWDSKDLPNYHMWDPASEPLFERFGLRQCVYAKLPTANWKGSGWVSIPCENGKNNAGMSGYMCRKNANPINI